MSEQSGGYSASDRHLQAALRCFDNSGMAVPPFVFLPAGLLTLYLLQRVGRQAKQLGKDETSDDRAEPQDR
jgi:hypothetical protein